MNTITSILCSMNISIDINLHMSMHFYKYAYEHMNKTVAILKRVHTLF